MTIKKLNTAKPAAPAGGAVAPAPGGAAIADRLRLDVTDTPKGAMVGKKAATYAFVAGLLSLAVVGVLTFMLYKHWEFLMPA